jgi:hypothetical protein
VDLIGARLDVDVERSAVSVIAVPFPALSLTEPSNMLSVAPPT